ncbi:hypothetical protein B4135_0989 [Caldibacillus debilis]|uniref:Uncharacterized protein n=1 Tax=Caldibacillus debilis TaxID=301148 RepID=A0A150MFB5_9BACI|nr:hypothetical protein B4135_0989 [Caldibacillus debilis]
MQNLIHFLKKFLQTLLGLPIGFLFVPWPYGDDFHSVCGHFLIPCRKRKR